MIICTIVRIVKFFRTFRILNLFLPPASLDKSGQMPDGIRLCAKPTWLATYSHALRASRFHCLQVASSERISVFVRSRPPLSVAKKQALFPGIPR
jgi:hypothetical protein